VQLWVGFVACTEFLRCHPILSNWLQANTRRPTPQFDYSRQIPSESKLRAIRSLNDILLLQNDWTSNAGGLATDELL